VRALVVNENQKAVNEISALDYLVKAGVVAEGKEIVQMFAKAPAA
jgi:hypothetical protein